MIWESIDAIEDVLGRYVFTAGREVDLQDQVAKALDVNGIAIAREVRVASGRIDIVATIDDRKIALELKLKQSTMQVEEQAQRYALLDEIAAVCVVTTSSRLANEIGRAGTQLGGKPSRAILLRTF